MGVQGRLFNDRERGLASHTTLARSSMKSYFVLKTIVSLSKVLHNLYIIQMSMSLSI